MWKDSVAGYALNGLKNTYKLRQSLLADKYKISPYTVFKIHEPKEREIKATRIKDRQFQRSLCDKYVYDEITNRFIRDNCACQKNRGMDDAIKRIKTHLHRFYLEYGTEGYALKCDIHHFFPETDHDVAKKMLHDPIRDDDAYERLCDIIDSFGEEKGIGLGSQVSQIIELNMLNGLDHFIKEKLHIKYYVRYMDDFVLIHQDKEYLKLCRKEIERELAELKLSLNKKTCIYPLKQGIKLLKWRFILTDTGKVVMKMSKKSIIKERRKLKKLKEKLKEGDITIDNIRSNFQSWQANARRGDTKHIEYKMRQLYKTLFEEEAPNAK